MSARTEALDRELLGPGGVPVHRVTIDTEGPGGNSYAIIGRCDALMRRAGVSGVARSLFMNEATSGSRDHLLDTIERYFRTTWVPPRVRG